MNKNEIEILENVINENEKNIIGFVTKMEIVSHMQGFDIYEYLQKDVKAKLLDYIYSFWIKSDLIENTLFDFVYLVFESVGVLKINKMNYKEFENIMNSLL